MKEETYYGIVYKKEKINAKTYFFLPQKLVEGICENNFFYAEEAYPIFYNIKGLESISFVVDSIYTKEELCRLYEFEDIVFLKEYFLDIELDSFLLVQLDGTKLTKRKIDIAKCFLDNSAKEMYSKGEEEIISLNSVALTELLDMQDVGELKERLRLYQTKLASFKAKNEKEGITKITLENGKMKEIETSQKKKKSVIVNVSSTSKEEINKEDISLKGLENYIKGRVFGQDDNIRKIAKTLFMNYTAIEGEKVEPILLVGPTGTGKTATMKVAMEYLNIPFIEVNSVNLVPQGIKGTSLEDCLHLLTLASGLDVQKAEKGILFFDEFDKLGNSKTDHKGDIVPILL